MLKKIIVRLRAEVGNRLPIWQVGPAGLQYTSDIFGLTAVCEVYEDEEDDDEDEECSMRKCEK